jgi:hypothetical protein
MPFGHARLAYISPISFILAFYPLNYKVKLSYSSFSLVSLSRIISIILDSLVNYA